MLYLQGATSMETFLRLLRFPQAFALLFAGQGVNMANLRLSLMDRQASSCKCAQYCRVLSTIGYL